MANYHEFMGKKVKAYEIKSSIDIHSAMDVEIAKILIKMKNLAKKIWDIKFNFKIPNKRKY